MIAKLNELRQSLDSNILEEERLCAKQRKELDDLQKERTSLEKEISLAEELARKAASIGFVKVKCKHFTYPFSYWGGGNGTSRHYGKEEIRYCDPVEALILLKKSEELSSGSGIEFMKVD